MKNIKKLMATCTALLIVASSFAGCTSKPAASSGSVAETPTEKQYKIAYTTMDLGSTYFAEVAKGVEEKGKELGWQVQIHDAKGEVGNQISALENFIAQKVDAILISPLEENASKSTIAKAKEANIKVVAMNSPIEGADVLVTPDETDMGYTIGKAAGQWAKENLEGQKVKVATYHVKEHPATITREEGMIKGIKEFVPDAEFITSLSALTTENGIENMEGIIQSHRDINIVVGCNDSGIMGSYQVAKASGLDLTKMYFGGIDAVPQALSIIKEEKAAGAGAYRGTVDITPKQTGVIAVETAQKLLAGKTVEGKVIIPAKLVSWENIDSYFEEK